MPANHFTDDLNYGNDPTLHVSDSFIAIPSNRIPHVNHITNGGTMLSFARAINGDVEYQTWLYCGVKYHVVERGGKRSLSLADGLIDNFDWPGEVIRPF